MSTEYGAKKRTGLPRMKARHVERCSGRPDIRTYGWVSAGRAADDIEIVFESNEAHGPSWPEVAIQFEKVVAAGLSGYLSGVAGVRFERTALLKAASAAVSALRSYEQGNAAPYLAKEVADALEEAMAGGGQ